MFDDLEPTKKEQPFPRNLETLSVSDLAKYITELEVEIGRVTQDIKKKKSSQEVAASVFK